MLERRNTYIGFDGKPYKLNFYHRYSCSKGLGTINGNTFIPAPLTLAQYRYRLCRCNAAIDRSLVRQHNSHHPGRKIESPNETHKAWLEEMITEYYEETFEQ